MTHNDQTPNNGPTEDDGRLPGILARPAGHLRALPLRYRWEVTRRHPYYLMLWEDASRETSIEDEPAAMLRQAQLAILGAIGVSGPLVPPETSIDAIVTRGDGTTPAWLSGSVQPLSMRGLTGLLLAHLTLESRRRLADLFRFSVEGSEEEGENDIEALLRLQSLDCDELDNFSDQPIVAISPVLTVNTLTSELRVFLDEWRERYGVVEQRVRIDKFDQYLAVWDARERWTGSGYGLGDDHRLSDVARQLGITPGTARNQYRAAFELITGHSYSIAKWLRICGPIKYPTTMISDIHGAVMRRRLQPRGARPPVPKSMLTPNADQQGLRRQSPSVENDDIATWELLEDLGVLLRAGRSDSEIAQELEIPVDAIPLLRQRYEVE